MMKWTRLQLNKLPIIAVEADNAIEKLQQLLARVNLHAINEDIQELNNLRQSIMARIQALDKFYQQNYLDSTINIFHMIKLKLKKAIFKISKISNETIQIQIKSPSHNMQRNFIFQQSRIRKNQVMRKNPTEAKSFEVFIKKMSKQKSRSNSRIKQKSKDNLLRLLQTSRRQQQDQTNLMEQMNSHNFKTNLNQHSFDFDHQDFQAYQPLFQPANKQKQAHSNQINKKNSSKNNIQIQKSQKSISPFKTKNVNNNFKTSYNVKKPQPKIKTQPNDHNSFSNKPNINSKININSYVSSNKNALQAQNKQKITKQNEKISKVVKKQPISQIDSKKQLNKKMRTEEQQIKISQSDMVQQNLDQFRFTIKMTKQEYKNLLKMKELMKNGKYT